MLELASQGVDSRASKLAVRVDDLDKLSKWSIRGPKSLTVKRIEPSISTDSFEADSSNLISSEDIDREHHRRRVSVAVRGQPRAVCSIYLMASF